MKGGAPQDWGLVEFSQAQEAEDTLRVLDGKLFHNSPVRVAFFIPGVRAINIYMKLLNDTVFFEFLNLFYFKFTYFKCDVSSVSE